MTSKHDQQLAQLYEVFAALESSKDAEKFLYDMLTPQEIETLNERWQLTHQLIEKVPQRQIAEDLGVAIATVSRGSRQLQYGSGGFKMMYDRVKKQHPHHPEA